MHPLILLASLLALAAPEPDATSTAEQAPPPPPAPEPGHDAGSDTPAPPPAPTAKPIVDPRAERAAKRAALARDATALRRREKAFFIAGGVIGGLGTLGHVVSSVFVVRAYIGAIDCQEDCYPDLSLIFDLVATVPMATGGALVGAGFGMRGRRHAIEDAIGQRSADKRMKRRGVLGWTLFGVGLGAYVATRMGIFFCADRCFVGVWEGGFWASAGLMTGGLVLGPYARGYNVARKKLAVQDLSLAPFTDRYGARGFSIAGRF